MSVVEVEKRPKPPIIRIDPFPRPVDRSAVRIPIPFCVCNMFSRIIKMYPVALSGLNRKSVGVKARAEPELPSQEFYLRYFFQ